MATGGCCPHQRLVARPPMILPPSTGEGRALLQAREGVAGEDREDVAGEDHLPMQPCEGTHVVSNQWMVVQCPFVAGLISCSFSVEPVAGAVCNTESSSQVAFGAAVSSCVCSGRVAPSLACQRQRPCMWYRACGIAPPSPCNTNSAFLKLGTVPCACTEAYCTTVAAPAVTEERNGITTAWTSAAPARSAARMVDLRSALAIACGMFVYVHSIPPLQC